VIIPHHLSAHKALCDQGILHRDISAGNVLLTRTQNVPFWGFITDLEFARIASSTLSKPQVTVTSAIGPQNRYDDRGHVFSRTQPTTHTHPTFESTVTVKRGAGMTVNYFDKSSFLPHWKLFIGNGSVHGPAYFIAGGGTHYRTGCARSNSWRQILCLGTLVLRYVQYLPSGFSTIHTERGPWPVSRLSIPTSPSLWPNHSQGHCYWEAE
jgi:hypothetical protein